VQPGPRRRRRIRRELPPQSTLAYERLGDPVLIARAQHGDGRALDAICARHAPRVEGLARHLLANSEDAQDAAQESLAKLCVRIQQFRGDSQFTTWLHRLVVNTCRDVAQRQARRRHEPLLEDLRAAPEGPDTLGLRDALCAALAEISPAQAKVVVLKDVLDLSFEEVAAVAEIPVGTAKCYAHRGREGLRAKLERDAAA
jgi:RNA polymerase sigma-70 factor (ECF subfamily)